MDAVAPGDAGRDGRNTRDNRDTRERSNSNRNGAVDYVRDGALAAHRRGLSGNLLSKFGFAKSTSVEAPKASNGSAGAAESMGMGTGTPGSDAAAASRAAMSVSGTRRSPTVPVGFATGHLTNRSRKGSLRKNILRKGSMQRMETILSPRADSRMSTSTDSTEGSLGPMSPDGDLDDDFPTPRGSYEGSRDYQNSRASSTGASRSPNGREGLWMDEGLGKASLDNLVPLNRSSVIGDNSTTDEDEKPPGSSSSNASSSLGLVMVPRRSSATSDSYFPLQPEPTKPSSWRKPSPMKSSRTTKSSPLAALPLDAASPGPLSPEMWDYGETEWWGWIILVVTWVTFVVGMGSCFGAWSWAWDVGETPYAPPELEDDPTLPIIGYYPALIVLTGVMAWVWVITAWVGMKYFKHARLSGEDG